MPWLSVAPCERRSELHAVVMMPDYVMKERKSLREVFSWGGAHLLLSDQLGFVLVVLLEEERREERDWGRSTSMLRFSGEEARLK